ncbi:MAG TPA: bifunctional precorrin-2 dehydrogenase/sirohydrochlorin ferrochelatase [Candidatus Acidoferrales bacterium]|nr:bifunctional precorrin-2 dehydrogenase/sirohydrochlorin ferrochelatase [Candidatus Acidoferrales bacterium]
MTARSRSRDARSSGKGNRAAPALRNPVKPAGLFPVFLKLAGMPCLVVGAGHVGQSKIESLLLARAAVRVVAPQATAAVRTLARKERIQWARREFLPADLGGIFLVVAATSSSALHDQIYRHAKRRGVLCNVVDDPEHCDFYYPAVVRRGPLQIAISTDRHSPSLAQHIRQRLEIQFGPEYAAWVERLGAARRKLFSRTMDPERRRRVLRRIARLRPKKGTV